MLFNNDQYSKLWETKQDIVCDVQQETGLLNVDATGNLVIVNTGGSDAAAGGMGSGSKDKTDKRDISDIKGNATTDKGRSDDAGSSDPVGKEIKKAEEEVGHDE